MKVKKLFTPAEANKTLPLVKRIVRDILERGKEMRALVEGEHRSVEQDSRIHELEGEVQELMGELEEVGCYYKDWGFEMGLVDFPAQVDGEIVFLCWRSDEDQVTWYHGIEAGYRGRKRIPVALLKS